MVFYKIIPHKGVGSIDLGMTRSEVHSILGVPQSSFGIREIFLDGFAVDYDENGCVEFIELSKSHEFCATFDGVCLHETLADEVVALVSKYADDDKTDPEIGYSYTFPKLQLSLWRGTLPDEGQDANDPDGRYFETVAIAKDGYLKQ